MCTENKPTLAISQENFTYPTDSGPDISITLERVLGDTARFGHRIYARQILLLIDVSEVFFCLQCHGQVTDIAVPGLDFVADVLNSEAGEYLANLLAEHSCAPLPAEALQ